MISVVMLSLGATFAAEDVDITADDVDEIVADEDVLAVEEDSQALAVYEVSTVTKDNISQYFDEGGNILENVTSDELVFEGTFEDINMSQFCFDRPIKLTGNEAVLNEISLFVQSDNITVSGFTINQESDAGAIFVYGSDITISDTTINFVDNCDMSSCAISAMDSNNLNLLNNVINYVGNTNGTCINNGIYIKNSNSTIVKGNKFTLSLVSLPIYWDEVPAGSGNYVSSVMSEGILIEDSEGVIFEDNDINVTYSNASGLYDTIYAVDFKNSDYAVIGNNNITALGHSYIYGIIISGENFNINHNVIKIESDSYYANGIDVEGPASGVVDGNNITAHAPVLSYPIYSNMNGKDVDVYYTDNYLDGEAYFVLGMSLGDTKCIVENNLILLLGNYTTGIASKVSDLIVNNNNIVLVSNEVGNESIWETFGIETAGIKVVEGNATLTNNNITTVGKGLSLENGEVDLTSNNIYVYSNDDLDSYAIYAKDLAKLNIERNIVTYVGATNGTGINNAVYVSGSNNATISRNKFTITLVSAPVNWVEEPAGSWNYVSYPVTEGIVVDSSNGVMFESNDVNVTYSEAIGDYDTIYAVDFKNSNDTIISKNTIASLGYSYIYGIIISGDNFEISNNIISTVSDFYYANGIDVEGPASGYIINNNISAEAPVLSYPIYSGMNGKDVSVKYLGNDLSGEAYFVLGMSLGDVESLISENNILLIGNYTTGIASKVQDLVANGNHIILVASEEGNESIWETFGVESAGIKVVGGQALISSNDISTPGKGVSIEKADADVASNSIYVTANTDKDAYGIYAKDSSNLTVEDNKLVFVGDTNGTGVNNGVYISNSSNTLIEGNTFKLLLVSAPVNWVEEPAGSWNYVSYPVTEGIVVDSSNGVTFVNNTVNTECINAIGSYDTIYAIDFKNSNDTVITNNVINANGHTYIYGLLISGQNFNIKENTILSKSDVYYANGIDVEGPATGVIEQNQITAKGVSLAYPIYAAMSNGDVSVNYIDNTLSGEAYFVLGMSLGGVDANVKENLIRLSGNYTTGIASNVAKLVVDDNIIIDKATNQGNESIWETFGVETVGVKIAKGVATVTNNYVKTAGEFAVKVADTNSSVHDNVLLASELKGDAAVDVNGSAEVYNNTPSTAPAELKETIIEVDAKFTRVANDYNAGERGAMFYATLKDADGNLLVNKTVQIAINGPIYNVTTDEKGQAGLQVNLANANVYTYALSFQGDDEYKASPLASSKLTVTKKMTSLAASGKTFKASAKTKSVSVTLKTSKNPYDGKTYLNKGKKITLKVGGKAYTAKTNAKGVAKFTIKLSKKGKYTAKIRFAGDKTYESSTKSISIKIK